MSNRADILKKFMGDYIDDNAINMLYGLSFFVVPASTKYHANYSGGLFDHSLTVAKELVNLTEKLGLKWKMERSPYIVGMFHDLCKCDNYICRNGIWEYNPDIIIPGHGEKSIMIAQQVIGQLTEEEMACIRWHMGAFDDKENWNKYGRAIEIYPNVLYTHTADMIAARVKGV